MAFRPVLLLGAALVGFAVMGCARAVKDHTTWSLPALSPAVPNVEHLAEQLNRDRWIANRDWTPRTEREGMFEGRPLPGRLRWKYYEPPLAPQKTRSEIDPTRRAALPTRTTRALTEADILPQTGQSEAERERRLRELVALAEQDNLSGWNAAILLAHWDPRAARKALPVLQRLAMEPPKYQLEPPKPTNPAPEAKPPVPSPAQQISLAMRSAAAEAWCLVLATEKPDAHNAFTAAEEYVAEAEVPEEIRAELFRGLARRVRPCDVAGLGDCLHHTGVAEMGPEGAELRRAAVDGCLVHAHWHPRAIDFDDPFWPDNVLGADGDGDPGVRQRVGEFLAVIRHPRAFDVLKAQLLDTDIPVRQQALVNLGLLKTDAARAELHVQAKKGEEVVRVYCVRGLAAWGEAELAPFAGDGSFSVRVEVAKQLGRYHSPSVGALLRDLLSDANLQVQGTALQSLDGWPDELACPLLLYALRSSMLRTRGEALAQLERRREEAITFPLRGSKEERAQAADQLAAEWKAPSEPWLRMKQDPNAPAADREIRLAEIRGRLEQIQRAPGTDAASEALEWLQHLNAADVPLLEQLAGEPDAAWSGTIYRDVLPRLSPLYAAVVQLEDRDVIVRRRAAQTLANAAQSSSLRPAVVWRLRELLVHEQDQLVWRSAMSSVWKEDSDGAAELALLAVNQTWSDIRILGCDYIAEHGRFAHAAWLLPLFADTTPGVRAAAMRAAARCRNPIVLDGPPGTVDGGVRALLRSPQVALRVEAASCMSCFGDEEALQEVIRLSHDASWKIRQQAMQAMGQSGQARFVDALISAAWTETDPNVKNAAVQSLNQLVPASDRPPELAGGIGYDRAIEVWAAWREQRQKQHPPSALLAPAIDGTLDADSQFNEEQ
jgi:HEAT repeat protein